MDRWTGRVAIVTGASVGIGAAISKALVRHGMTVVGCSRNPQQIEALDVGDAKGKLVAMKCDVRQESDILDMFRAVKENYGGVHVLINNAGVAFDATVLSGETEKWRTMFDVNVIGLSICTREAVKCMREKGIDDGHIINICSLAGHKVMGRGVFYSASKYAVRALTEGTRHELRAMKSNIKISEISPGLVKTEFSVRARGEEIGSKLYADNPYMQAEDIADAVIYTLSTPPHVQVQDILVEHTNAT